METLAAWGPLPSCPTPAFSSTAGSRSWCCRRRCPHLCCFGSRLRLRRCRLPGARFLELDQPFRDYGTDATRPVSRSELVRWLVTEQEMRWRAIWQTSLRAAWYPRAGVARHVMTPAADGAWQLLRIELAASCFVLHFALVGVALDACDQHFWFFGPIKGLSKPISFGRFHPINVGCSPRIESAWRDQGVGRATTSAVVGPPPYSSLSPFLPDQNHV